MRAIDINRVLNLNSNTTTHLADDLFHFNRVITDSRKAQKGDLFFAIVGESMDGHAYIESALAKGASGVVMNANYALKHPISNEIYVAQVPDTLEAFRKVGAYWRSEFQIPVVCIAGSVGKTTTKEIFAAILRGKFSCVLKTQGSQNGYLGIPMTLLELHSRTEAAVVEVGIDEIGAMKKHIELLRPTAALLTVIAPEHLEKLKDIETVANEERIAIEMTSQMGGQVCINLDDPEISPLASTYKNAFTYSMNPKKTPTVLGTIQKLSSNSEGRFDLEIKTTHAPAFLVTSPLAGEHNAHNLLAACALALQLGLQESEIKKGLETFEGAAGRSEVKTLAQHQIVCDYYNANPASMRAAFALTFGLSPEKDHYACLADMLELGPNEEQFHRELAKDLLKNPWKGIYLFGERMKWLLNSLQIELKSNPVQSQKLEIRHFQSKKEMKTHLFEKMGTTSSVALIKGSRSMKMEEVLE